MDDVGEGDGAILGRTIGRPEVVTIVPDDFKTGGTGEWSAAAP